ncbi:permease of the drug/metabolite transporter [Salinisphaera sp. T5B8]|uniref:DMT family transporter n=1 Tax=Salinisphaera sp. T5B8 TaxID=1304154 RepID=UPI0033410BFD
MALDQRPYGSDARLLALGLVVVLMWGITAWLRKVASDLPPLELTGLAMLAAALCSGLWPANQGALRRAPRRHPWYAWVFVSGGLLGGAAFYFAALEFAPAAQVVVVTYTWPLLFALTSDAYRRRRPSLLTLVSLLLGLAGVVVMNGGVEPPSGSAWVGYVAGLLAGLSWVAYSLFQQVYERELKYDLPVFFLAAGVLSLTVQAMLGTGLVWPRAWTAYAAAGVLGAGPYGLGFIGWGHVVRNGNPRVIPTLPYAVPAVSALALVLAGDTQPSLTLFAGCFLALTGCISAFHQRSSRLSGAVRQQRPAAAHRRKRSCQEAGHRAS